MARTAPHEGVRGTLTFMDLLTRPIPDAPAGGVVDGSRDVPILLEHTKGGYSTIVCISNCRVYPRNLEPNGITAVCTSNTA